jgi:glycosyltransferase involved in cell wall biosynthesis
MTSPLVFALVPAYNEASTIAEVVRGAKNVVDAVTVVDDGSTDDTAEIARGAGATVMTLPVNAGKGAAIRHGLEALLLTPCTHILLIDGDLQHLPHEAANLLAVASTTAADLVIGERQFNRSAMPASRYYANRLGSRALSWFIGMQVRDTQCGFRLYAADALRGLPLHGRGYEIETEMLVKLRRRGGTIASAPITAVYAGRGSKLRPVRDTTKTCFLAVYYRFLERL